MGNVVGSAGTVLSTTNGGEAWILHPRLTDGWLNSVCFTDANTAYVVGDAGAILRNGEAFVVHTPQLSKPAAYFELFPNPAHTRVTIQHNHNLAEPGFVSIYNLAGHLLLQNPLVKSTELDVSSFPRGIYIVRVQSGELSQSRKLVIR